jgi:2',3'-cyclic-nucleotide 2'-phosphodiesterase (5'-nucleotidase family)
MKHTLKTFLFILLAVVLAACSTDSSGPTAAFTVTPSTGDTNTSFAFDASGSSADGDLTIDAYQWSFGDGSEASGPTLSYSYSEPGEYEVTLTVTDSGGSTDTATETITVSAPASAFQLQVLHFADVDGGGDIIGNAPRFSALLDSFRSERPDTTLVLSSGDNWIPGPEYSIAAEGFGGTGRAHVEWLNGLGVDASALGNHEFDLGTNAIVNLLSADGDWPGASFPYLATNLDFSTDLGDADDPGLASIAGSNGLPADQLAGQVAGYTVIDVDGETVGIVGAITPLLATISTTDDVTILPANAPTTAEAQAQALAPIIQTSVDALTASGVDKIILLAHMQNIQIERTLATLLTDVDVIIAGGSNTLLADDNDRLRDGDSAADDYPLIFSNPDGDTTLVVNTDGDYNYLGRLVVDFDSTGVILTDLLDNTVNGAYATDAEALGENNLTDDDAIDAVEETADTLEEDLSAVAGNVFGSTSVYLNGERAFVRTEETNLGNLTADANLAYAQSVDASTTISLKNGGGIRAPIGACVVPPGSVTGELECNPPAGTPGINEPGQISQLDLEIALRFNNGLTLVTVTGAQLLELMEHGLAEAESTAGRFPQIAGMTVTYNINADPNTRITDLTILDSNGAEASGEAVELVSGGVIDGVAAAQTFRIVTLGFLAGGGDGYPFPAEDDEAANFVDLEQEGVRDGAITFADTGSEQDVLAEYLNVNFPADGSNPFSDADTPLDQDTRIIQTQ